MKRLSLAPDEWMKYIYDPQHPEYNTERVRDLRERRAAALASAPRWMMEEAAINDLLRESERRAKK